VTCKKDIQECAIHEEDNCNFIVGCNENEKNEVKKAGTFSNMKDLLSLLEKLYSDKKDVIQSCQSESDKNIPSASGTSVSGTTCTGGKCDYLFITQSFVLLLNCLLPLIY
jgi:hypothetical protein